MEGVSPTLLLETGPRNRIWENKSLKDIAADVLDAAQSDLLPRDVAGIPSGPTFPFEAQYQESDFHFLCRLCQREQVWAYYDGEQLKLTGAPKSSVVNLNLHKGGPGKLESFAVAAHCWPGNFQYRAFMAGTAQDVQKSQQEFKKPGGLHPYVDLASDRSAQLFARECHPLPLKEVRAEADATRHAQALGSAWLSSLMEVRGECEWVGLRPGGAIKVDGAGNKEDGDYLITRVEHQVTPHGGYTASFSALPVNSARPQWDRARQPTPSLHHAIVLENYDKKYPGQVKIRYCHHVDGTTEAGKSSNGSAVTTWTRVASPHAGEKGGFFALPEPGDEVLVGHIDGRADQPVVLASVYNGMGSKTIEALTGDLAANDGKAFRTKSGNLILFRDTAGKERIEITTPDAKNRITLTMDGGTHIELESEGKVLIRAKDVIGIEAGSDISMKADGAFSLKAKKGVCIESTSDAVAVKALKTADITGTQGVNIKGAKIDIKGDGPVEVKGALIKLN